MCVATMSCTRLTVLRTQEIMEVQYRVDSLRSEIEIMEEAQTQEAETAKTAQVSVELLLQRLIEMVQQLSGNLSESQIRLSELNKKTGALTLHMAEEARKDSLVQTSQEQERFALFDLALTEYKSGEYQVAIDALTDYIAQYPDTEEAKDAVYWQGECFLAMKKLTEAEELFKQYYGQNQAGKHACLVLFKLGMVYDQQNKKTHRNFIWEKLLEHCPETPEGQLAKEKMKVNP